MNASFIAKLKKIWTDSNSYLCVGLDPDIRKLPKHLLSEKFPIFEFNKQIIEETARYVCAFKPQLAYYSGQGVEDQLHMTLDFLHKEFSHIPILLDAKRGDIGSTADMYAKEAFEVYKADAVTVNPYMGMETVEPFLKDKSKGVFVLCKTSNPNSDEYQNLKTKNGRTVYEHVALAVDKRAKDHSGLGLVVGATHVQDLKNVRALAPDVPILVPGVGEQGGSIEDVILYGRDSSGYGLIISSSRSIIYAGQGKDFAKKSNLAAKSIFEQMQRALNK